MKWQVGDVMYSPNSNYLRVITKIHRKHLYFQCYWRKGFTMGQFAGDSSNREDVFKDFVPLNEETKARLI